MTTIRGVCEAGHGAWLGAFRENEMQSGLGIFDIESGVARFQDVDTHPAHRRQGLATYRLLAAEQYARTHFDTSTLVIAADPENHAISIYRSLGFGVHEQHIQLERLNTET
jgi:GNAT superfamily N-acetyltransferase